MYLDIYLLRPPNHGQTLLANAQTQWLSGEGSFSGPTAASADWRALGMSGDPGALAACLEAATKGQLVLACYEATSPTPGHVAIVRPAKEGNATVPSDGPEVIMAGDHNYTAISMRRAFSNHPAAWPDNIALFAHDTALQHDAGS